MPRLAIVRKERCHSEGCGHYLCARLCPVNRSGNECITEGKDRKAVIAEELCTGCGICPKRCPFEALSIINLPQELTKQPIHAYGHNGFHLYNLPMPIFGKTVGIVGQNGIGKSTALKIVAGLLKPNLGQDKEASYDELLKYFKGTEAQGFFEQVKSGKIKVSYKPQQVDMIPKTAKGTVAELLKKADEKKSAAFMSKLCEELVLNEILDTDISKISGGELQRVAIAAAVLKKANLYIFDEPTSYLDIKQRISVSKFINSIADAETAVLVVEHDLVILDEMADLVHIMYGKEGCYGIVSMPRATRSAINVYLEGYMKEENVRFRDYEIKFSANAPSKLGKALPLSSWHHISKKLGKFEISAKEGSVNRKECTGIVGENGIGKTTFAKILSGLIKPDDGEIDKGVRVSYKPQYIETSSDEIVATVLKDAISKYEVQIMRPLELKLLLTKKLNELSGGELQRVAIAACLSREAEVYLLDEPSAYLDVEQRLAVAKAIKEISQQRECSVMVIDHDLMFVDYLSDRIMVFEGVPANKGEAKGPFAMEEGMNTFLKILGITLRRDKDSNRPRINKFSSRLDKEQKETGKYYYA
jgi:ATP-binding cassette subfamily E protein 1